MIKLYDGGVFLREGTEIVPEAEAAARALGCMALADDSGICVEALGGAPGVYSARYCGRHGDDDANNALLLRNLEGIPAPRKARYVAAIALVRSGHAPIVCRGTCEGEILTEGRGNGGFGYDPHFYVPDFGRTAAELTAEEKNDVSHRGRAMRMMLEELADRWGW